MGFMNNNELDGESNPLNDPSLQEPGIPAPTYDDQGNLIPADQLQLQTPAGPEAPDPNAALPPDAVPVAPGPPEMVRDKTGKTTNETTYTKESQASKDAMKDYSNANQDKQLAAGAATQAEIGLNDVIAKKDKKNSEIIAKYDQAKVAAHQQMLARVSADIGKRDAMVAEFANQKPETFWGSKGEADKVTASLSVGLGAIGQALLGSGENIGSMLLKRNMEEFDRNQKMQYDKKVKQIEQMSVSIQDKRQMMEDLDKFQDARKVAQIEQVNSKYVEALNTAKTPKLIANLQAQQASLQSEAAKVKMEQEAKYAEKHQQSVEKDTIELVRADQTKAGQKGNRPLTENQAKAGLALADVLSANQALKKVDEAAVVGRGHLDHYYSDSASYKGTGKLWGVGPAVQAAGAAVFGTPEQKLTSRDPEAAVYRQSADLWTNGVIRYKSGANIPVMEKDAEYEKYWPIRGDTPEILANKAKARAELEKAMRVAAGQGGH